MFSSSFSDTELILLVLGVIYVTESCAWLREGNAAFLTFFGRYLAPRTYAPIANDRGGVVFGSPLPFDRILFGEPCPVSISPEGVVAYSPATLGDRGALRQTQKHVRFGEIKALEAQGSSLFVNGEVFVTLRTSSSAQRLCSALLKVREQRPENRPTAIRQFLKQTMDLKRIEEELGRLQQETSSLRIACSLLFTQLFVIGPALYFTYRGTDERYSVLWKYLLLTATCWFATALLYYRSHRKLYPGDVGQRRKQLLTYMVSPASAIRAADSIGRDTFVLTHPIALASVICSGAELQVFAKRIWIDYLHPLPAPEPITDPEALGVIDWFRIELGAVLTELFRSLGFSPEELAAAPESSDPEARTYCPRCRREFVLEAGNCEDCGGLELASLH